MRFPLGRTKIILYNKEIYYKSDEGIVKEDFWEIGGEIECISVS